MDQILSKNQIKLIRSLKQKKSRYKLKKYLIEGEKMIAELCLTSPLSVDYIVSCLPDYNQPDQKIYKTDVDTFKSISNLQNPQGLMAVCEMPASYFSSIQLLPGFYLYLDAIQDPGNLGTIMRTADWFGIQSVLIGEGSVDPFSSKSIQASMSSIFNVDLIQYSAVELLNCGLPILVTAMDGDNVYHFDWKESAVLVLGNEGNGVSDILMQASSQKLTIPGSESKVVESLNVAMSTMSLLTLRDQSIRSKILK